MTVSSSSSPPRKPHLSASQLEMAAKCPEQYRRRYIEGEKIPPGIALLMGTGFHAGAETNFRQKIDSHVDLPTKQIVEAAVAGFEAGVAGGLSLSEEESSRGTAIVIGEAKDTVADLALVHAKQQAPDYQPIAVEQEVRIELPGPRDLLGVIDLADDQRRVVDFKTARKSKAQNDADSSIQLSVYSAAYEALHHEPPAEVRLDTVVNTKTRVYRQVVSSSRNQADHTALANRINTVNQLLQAGIFPPASPGAWWCAPKWCGYFNAGCPYVNSERKALAETVE